MADADAEQLAVPIVWVGAEDIPILATNQMLIQHSGRDEFVLTFGQVTPPILLGSEDQQVEQLKLVSYVPIKSVVRVGFTRDRLKELIDILEGNLATHDERFKPE